MKLSTFLFYMFILGLLPGCINLMPPTPDDPRYAPVMPNYPVHKVSDNGSLYQQSSFLYLYEDVKARRIGDIITVVLTESTNASKNADTEISKETDVSLSNPTIAGTQVTFDNDQKSFELGVSGENEFKAESDTAQSNRLNGTISVTVHQVLPNGYLVVRGEKWITLNQGNEFIRISGIIRPNDVSAENMIDSNRLANARIQYSGTGPLAEANTQGWLTRFFNSGWWPF